MSVTTITLAKKDILFDIDASTHILSSITRAKGDIATSDEISTDSDEDFHLRVLTRFADEYCAKVVTLIASELSSQNLPTTNVISSATNYQISLSLHPEFKSALLATLTSLMHEYIVKGAIREWLELTGASDKNIGERLVEIEKRIRRVVFSRELPSISAV